MDFSYFDQESYSDLVLYILKEKKNVEDVSLNKKQLSEKLGLQQSHLSRFFAGEVFLNSDHHYLLKKEYDFNKDESEFLDCLYDISKTGLESRSAELLKKKKAIRLNAKDAKKSLQTGSNVENLNSENLILYYHQPYHMIVHMLLICESIGSSTKLQEKLIQEKLGIPQLYLVQILERLRDLKFICIVNNKYQVAKPAMHLEKSSPFQKTYQAIMKNFSQNYLLQFPDKAIQNYSVTFTLSDKNMEQASSLFLKLVKDLQDLSLHEKPDNCYQFNLDFFKY